MPDNSHYSNANHINITCIWFLGNEGNYGYNNNDFLNSTVVSGDNIYNDNDENYSDNGCYNGDIQEVFPPNIIKTDHAVS